MTGERERLVCFFYLLTRGTPHSKGMAWGDVNTILKELGSKPNVYTSKGGEALANEMADRILGPAPSTGEAE